MPNQLEGGRLKPTSACSGQRASETRGLPTARTIVTPFYTYTFTWASQVLTPLQRLLARLRNNYFSTPPPGVGAEEMFFQSPKYAPPR